MKRRPSFFATAPVVPEPKNGSSTTSPVCEAETRMRWISASGFWVGWTFRPAPCFRRSSLVQSGKSRSERICVSSLPALSAS